MKNKRIGFVWQGVTDRIDYWHDGLRAAIESLKKEYYVEFLEPDYDLSGYDVLLYWEAPCTINGANSDKYNMVRLHPSKKVLLFAGGPVNPQWVQGFQHICVESQINKEEFAQYGIHTTTAFGINDVLFRPIKVKKKYKAIHHGTCASWKRQDLFAKAFGKDGVLVGRNQPTDPYPFIFAKECGTEVLDEQNGEQLVRTLNSAQVLCQTSDYWGGGQRATLEAMACGIPVICMEDSPKNREYVEESGAGIVCRPEVEDIRKAYDEIIKNYELFSKRGIDYVESKWRHDHYAKSLKEVIENI